MSLWSTLLCRPGGWFVVFVPSNAVLKTALCQYRAYESLQSRYQTHLHDSSTRIEMLKAIKFTMRDYCNLIPHLAREDQTLSNKVSTLGISDMMKVAYVADDARKVLMLAAGGITELSGLLVIDHGGELVTPRGKVALLMEDLQLDGKQIDANHRSQTPPCPYIPTDIHGLSKLDLPARKGNSAQPRGPARGG